MTRESKSTAVSVDFLVCRCVCTVADCTNSLSVPWSVQSCNGLCLQAKVNAAEDGLSTHVEEVSVAQLFQ